VSTAAKTHILRVKPPWRQDRNRTRCGRRAESRMAAIWPDAQMAATARPYWQWRAIIGGGNRHLAPAHIRDTFLGTPAGLRVPCWLNLGQYGYQDWRADPLEVLRVDLAIRDDHGRKFLARELIALADLVAAHPEEFRQAMQDEAVLAALAGIGSPRAGFPKGAHR
jgi:hypothetical protein